MKNLLPLAIELAQNLPYSSHRVAAIITDRKNRVIATGFNSFVKTSPLQKKFAELVGEPSKVYNHAEIASINALRYGSRPFAIYVARVNKAGEPLMAKPCKICQLALKDYQIKNIFHT